MDYTRDQSYDKEAEESITGQSHMNREKMLVFGHRRAKWNMK
jgi:hypothetical protein